MVDEFHLFQVVFSPETKVSSLVSDGCLHQ
jgi:hypothetical protein